MAFGTSKGSAVEDSSRHAVVTPDDHGPVLNIVAWFLMVTFILATLLKLAIRAVTRVVGMDDVFSVLAMLFGIGEVIAISLGVNDGLGTRSTLLTEFNIRDVEKATYAASLLYVFALAFAKASIVLLMQRLFVERKYKTVNQALSGLVAVWAIGSLFAVAFNCGLPNPWNYIGRSCADMRPLWYSIGIIDIVMDVAFIVLPAFIVRTLQMDSMRKFAVVSVFALRIVVIGAQIARLAILGNTTENSDQTYPIAFWIATQVQIAAAVIVSCTPALKPFMSRAASGMMAVSLENREGTYNVSGAYHMQDMPSKTGGSNKGVMSRDKRNGRDSNLSPDAIHHTTVSSRIDHAPQEEEIEDNRSDKNFIRKTTGYEVEYS